MSPALRSLVLSIVLLPVIAFAAPAQAAGCPAWNSGDPCLTLAPAAGPVGTHVRISGRITSDLAMWRDQFRDPAYFALLQDVSRGCELIGGTEHGTIALAADGTVTGSFTVGGTGTCFQGNGAEVPIQPGNYVLAVGCHAGGVGYFTVTRGSLPFTGSTSLLFAAAIGASACALGGLTMRAARRP